MYFKFPVMLLFFNLSSINPLNCHNSAHHEYRLLHVCAYLPYQVLSVAECKQDCPCQRFATASSSTCCLIWRDGMVENEPRVWMEESGNCTRAQYRILQLLTQTVPILALSHNSLASIAIWDVLESMQDARVWRWDQRVGSRELLRARGCKMDRDRNLVHACAT
jgi:hypothetical protein